MVQIALTHTHTRTNAHTQAKQVIRAMRLLVPATHGLLTIIHPSIHLLLRRSTPFQPGSLWASEHDSLDCEPMNGCWAQESSALAADLWTLISIKWMQACSSDSCAREALTSFNNPSVFTSHDLKLHLLCKMNSGFKTISTQEMNCGAGPHRVN